jgi:hypothetical protein
MRRPPKVGPNAQQVGGQLFMAHSDLQDQMLDQNFNADTG